MQIQANIYKYIHSNNYILKKLFPRQLSCQVQVCHAQNQQHSNTVAFSPKQSALRNCVFLQDWEAWPGWAEIDPRLIFAFNVLGCLLVPFLPSSKYQFLCLEISVSLFSWTAPLDMCTVYTVIQCIHVYAIY